MPARATLESGREFRRRIARWPLLEQVSPLSMVASRHLWREIRRGTDAWVGLSLGIRCDPSWPRRNADELNDCFCDFACLCRDLLLAIRCRRCCHLLLKDAWTWVEIGVLLIPAIMQNSTYVRHNSVAEPHNKNTIFHQKLRTKRRWNGEFNCVTTNT